MTARDVYNRSLALIHEHNSDGPYDTLDFQKAAPELINLLCTLLEELDLHIKGQKFHENALTPHTIQSLDDEVLLHPILCSAVLPLGLAFLFLTEENSSLAGIFCKLYESERESLRRRFLKGRRHKITNLY